MAGRDRDGLALRVLRTLLLAYPARFRREYGAAMLQSMRDGLEDARRTGRRTAFAFWWRAVVDLIAGGVRMRLRDGRRRNEGRPGERSLRSPQRGLVHHVDVLATDLNQALRAFGRSPVSSLTTVLLLGLAIGLTTLTFTAVYATTIRDLPYHRVDRIVEIDYWGERRDDRGRAGSSFRIDVLGDVADVFNAIADFREQKIPFDDGSGIRLVPGAEVTPGLFELLGVAPAIGRSFVDEDARPGAPGTVVLGHDLWTSSFQGRSDALGATVEIRGATHTVIGVMPEGFGFSYYARLWVPFQDNPALSGMIDGGVVARLRDGASIEEANERLEALRVQLAAAGVAPFADELDDWASDWRFFLRAKPLGWERWDELGWQPYAALAPVGLALLIACANVAGLMLARGAARGHEMTLRVVLGGSRRRLARQLLTEAGVIVGCAGILGLLFVSWATPALRRTAERVFDEAFPFGLGAIGIDSPVPAWMRLTPDATVIVFVFAACALVVALVGLVPAREGSRPDLGAALRAAGYGATAGPRSRFWMKALTVAQVALSVVLVAAAAMTLQSLSVVAGFDSGMDVDRVLHVQIGERQSSSAAAEDPRTASLRQRARDLYAAHPDVEYAAAVWHVEPDQVQRAWSIADSSFIGLAWPPALGEERGIFGRVVEPDYFAATGLQLVRGRGIEARDLGGSQRVVVVSESTARLGWPDEDPIGRQIRLVPDGPAYTVIGLVEDQRRFDQIGQPSRRQSWRHVYLPAAGLGVAPDYLVVRARTDPVLLAEPLRRIAYGLDPTVPVTIRKLNENDSLFAPVLRWSTRLLAGIGIGALALAAVGMFSVVSYGTARRTREMGLRTALGAGRGNIVGLVLHQALRLAVIGLACGIVLAAALGRLAAGFLFGLSSAHPVAYAGITAVVLAIAALAAWQPADRAARIDPAIALRDE